MLVDAALEDLGVGDEQVVAHQLDLVTELLGEGFPAVPVGLVHAVLDGDDRVTVAQLGQVVGEAGGVHAAVLAGQHVLAVLVELAGGAVQGQGDVLAGLVARLVDGFHDRFQGRLVAGQVRGEAALVTDGGVQAAGLEHALQGVEHLGAVADRLGHGGRAHRLDHEFLDVHVVVGVLTAVDDVHHRHRQGVLVVVVLQVGDVFVERLFLGLGFRLGRRQGHRQDGVGAQVALVVGAVGVDHRLVQRPLVGGVAAHQQLADLGIDVAHGAGDALAQVAGLVAVTQLQRFPGAGGGTAGRAGAGGMAGFQGHIGFDGGVAAGIKNLAGLDVNNLGHGRRSPETVSIISGCRRRAAPSRYYPGSASAPGMAAGGPGAGRRGHRTWRCPGPDGLPGTGRRCPG